jgi:hypothetical protein
LGASITVSSSVFAFEIQPTRLGRCTVLNEAPGATLPPLNDNWRVMRFASVWATYLAPDQKTNPRPALSHGGPVHGAVQLAARYPGSARLARGSEIDGTRFGSRDASEEGTADRNSSPPRRVAAISGTFVPRVGERISQHGREIVTVWPRCESRV